MTSSQDKLTRLGFHFGINGPHAARTMMLADLRKLLSSLPQDATRADYAQAVLGDNVLAKSTKVTRALSLRHLSALYLLDPANPLFRALRRLWNANERAQPLLALMLALCRDPLLRSSREFVLGLPVGAAVDRSDFETLLSREFPNRFSPASMRSFAQNVGGTWTEAGFLIGRRRKVRVRPEVDAETLAYALFLGYLEGRTGQRLFSSDWVSLLGCAQDEAENLAAAAAHKGHLVFMNAGGVKEVRFPDYLTPEEDQLRQEIAHVV